MSDSSELLDAILRLKARLAWLERERPQCPDCDDSGWTPGGTPCGCRFSPPQYQRRAVK